MKQLAVGAAAGATIQVGNHIWGPNPKTETPIFSTTIAEVCATLKDTVSDQSPKVTDRAVPNPIHARQDLTEEVLTTQATYVGKSCISQGLVNCPANLQVTSQATVEKVTTVMIGPGESATWPASVFDFVESTITFGENAKSIRSTSGGITSYTAGELRHVTPGAPILLPWLGVDSSIRTEISQSTLVFTLPPFLPEEPVRKISSPVSSGHLLGNGDS